MKADYSYLGEVEKYGPHLPQSTLEMVLSNIDEAEKEGIRVMTFFGVWDAVKSCPDYRLFFPLKATNPQVRDAKLTVDSARMLRPLVTSPETAELAWKVMALDSHYYATVCFPHMRNAVAKPGGKRKSSAFKVPVGEALKAYKAKGSEGPAYAAVEHYLKVNCGVKKDTVSDSEDPEGALLHMGEYSISVGTLRRYITRWSRI